MKKIKNITKRTKTILMSIFVGVLMSATGITLYAQDNIKKVEQTREIYHSFVIPSNIDNYNDSELSEYNELLSEREKAFNKLNVEKLKKIYEDFERLDLSVVERIKNEKIQKQYDDKKKEVEEIVVLDGANDNEKSIFNTRKHGVLQMINDKRSFEEINSEINILKATNVDIKNRIDNETGGNSNISDDNNDKYDNNNDKYDNNDDYYDLISDDVIPEQDWSSEDEDSGSEWTGWQ